ncbi:ring-hydroxylating dioxygenase, large terminal subunit [Cyanobium gracile PCC 6307]|uniref:Ring-hydroxylating dioxygenase, large terminal subunit n=1 Tax=Cyanobium gracile (strain ATCC 27147 / PCC 6307) TaxID=292564 RepID=K9P9D2_CYAGP|nr:ring-hydroxylating dioxygenase, large terminal subunit [Cyanobium gracile PCC 6307]
MSLAGSASETSPPQVSQLAQNCWYAVASSFAFRKGPVAVPFAGHDFVLFPDAEGLPRLFSDRCPHRGASLALGQLEEGGCLRCPFHGWKFAADGTCLEAPAEPAGASPPARSDLVGERPAVESRGFIWMWWGSGPPDPALLPDLPVFPDEAWGHVESSFDWETHYSRVIESNLDNSHAYWVHKGTFASQDSPLSVPVDLRKEDRMIAATVSFELPVKGALKLLRTLSGQSGPLCATTTFSFYYPNLNIVDTSIGDQLRFIFFNASLPQSDTHTLARWVKYSKRKRFRLPGSEAQSIAISRTIFEEDHGVVRSQRPTPVPLDLTQERHVASDILSIEYRRMHRRWLSSEAAVTMARPEPLGS